MKLSQSVKETLCTLEVRQQQWKRVGKKVKYLVRLWRRLEKLMRSRHFKVWQYFSQQVDRSCCLPHLWVRDIYLINSWPFLMRRPQELPSDTDHSHSAMSTSLGKMSSAILIWYLFRGRYSTCVTEGQGESSGRIIGFVAYLTPAFLLEMLSLRSAPFVTCNHRL